MSFGAIRVVLAHFRSLDLGIPSAGDAVGHVPPYRTARITASRCLHSSPDLLESCLFALLINLFW